MVIKAERKTVDGVRYIKNTETKRWVKESGVTATRFMTKHGLTRLGNTKTKRKALYNLTVEREVKGWKILDFTRKTPVTLTSLANTIIALLKPNMKNIVVTFKGERTNDDPPSFRSMKMKNDISKKELLTAMKKAQHQIYKDGSDMFDAGTEFDTRWFRIAYKTSPIGNSGRKDFTILKTEYFRCKSYPATHGDCLLAILRNGKHISTIRKDLDLEGGIKIEDIPTLEEYFGVNINVYSDNIIIKKEIKDTERYNSTTVEYEYEYYYKSKMNEDGEEYDILLKDEHYTEIIEKKDLYFDPVCGDKLITRAGIPIELTNLARKKSLIRQGRRIAGDKKENEEALKAKFLFFDIETIFNPENSCLLEPYSVAFHVADAEVKPTKFTEKNINNYISETHFITGKGCMDKFIEWIENNDSGIKYTLIGYNNSRFDNYPLLRAIISADLYPSILFVQNSILQLRFGGKHTCFDLCRFTMCSLDKACEDFKVYPHKQKGFSHYEPQNAFMEGGWPSLNGWIEENYENLQSYNKIDVLATENLFYIIRMAYLKLTTKDVLNYTTLASLSYDRFKELNKETKYDIPAPETYEDDNFIRSAIVGGRCQDFDNQTDTTAKLACVDVKSLYPYIMMNRYFPYGEYKRTKKYMPNKLGIYSTVIASQPEVKIIPNRDDKLKLLEWDSTEVIEHTMTSIEIECLKRHGGEFEFIQMDDEGNIGIYWEKSTDKLFLDYFTPIKDEKTRQDKYAKDKDDRYNPALRNITKLLLNSLSGKQVQRNFTEKTELVKNIKEEESFENKTKDCCLKFAIGDYRLLSGELNEELIYKRKNAKPSYLGVFIYAHARSYMYDLIYSNYDTLYTDTDSGILSYPDYENFKNKFIETVGEGNNKYYRLTKKDTGVPTIGTEFGQFEEELESEGKTTESYIIGKKMYCVEMKKNGVIDKKSKYRLKGINIFRDRVISKKEVKKISEMEEDEKIEYIYKLKKQLDKDFENKITEYKNEKKIENIDINRDIHYIAEANNFIQIFRNLNKGVAYFLCGGIKKTSAIEMKQAYSIKKLSACGEVEEYEFDEDPIDE